MSDSNETQAAEPTSFKLLHANVHGCEDYQRKTLLTAANSKCYRHHVIMFQEAWRRTKTTKFPGYRLAHSNDIEASDTYVSFAIYVRNDIPIKSYRPARIFCTCSGATRAFHEKNIGTICYDLKDGRELYVTCFYNQKARAELACLISTLRLGGPNALHIFGGDSNLHGRWGGPDIQYDSAGVALYDAFVEEGLQLLNTEGQYTWHGVRGDEGVESFTGIDITFASAELCCPLFPFWDIVRDAELADTRMDHFAIQVIFDGLLDEPKPQRHYALDEVDPKEFGTRVEDRLRGLPRSFQSNAQLDWFAEQFMARMSDVVEEHVPLVESKPRRSKFTVKDTPQMQELKRARNRLSRDWHTRVKIASRAFQASNDRSTRRKEAIFANAKRVKAELRQHEERIQQLHRIEFTKLWRGSFFETEDTVRRLTRWAIGKGKPARMAFIPDFDVYDPDDDAPDRVPVDVVHDTMAKGRLLWETWKPPPHDPQESDSEDEPLGPPLQASRKVTREAFERVLKKQRTHSAPGKSGFANSSRVLKLCLDVIEPYLRPFYAACFERGYFPNAFKNGIVLPVPKAVGPYTDPSRLRPIELIEPISKGMERLLADVMANLAVKHELLPKTQMCFRGRSTISALLYFLEVVRAARRVGLVISILSIDIKGAFNRMQRRKLLKMLRKKGYPDWVVRLIDAFLSGRHVDLRFPGHVDAGAFDMEDGCPQGSPLSALLFILFASGLLDFDIIEVENGLVLKMAYMDDTYLIAISQSIAINVDLLGKEHEKCMQWARKYNQQFSKYQALHICTNEQRKQGPSLSTVINGFNSNQDQETTFQMLGIIIQVSKDGNLVWDAQYKKIQKRSESLLAWFQRLVRSTYGYGPEDSIRLYTQYIRPCITYACAVWYTLHEYWQSNVEQELWVDPEFPPNGWTSPEPEYEFRSNFLTGLKKIQNQFLRAITSAPQQARTTAMLKETNLEDIWIYVDRVTMAQRAQIWGTEVGNTIEKVKRMVEDFGTRLQWSGRVHRGGAVNQLEQSIISRREDRMEVRTNQRARRKAGISDMTGVLSVDEQKRVVRFIKKECQEWAEQMMIRDWELFREREIAFLRGISEKFPIPAFLLDNWGKEVVELYAGMRPPFSSILFQVRTGYAGFREYLCRTGAKNINTPHCQHCFEQKYETVDHLYRHCTALKDQRARLRQAIDGKWDHLFTKHGQIAAEYCLRFFPPQSFNWTLQYMMPVYFPDVESH